MELKNLNYLVESTSFEKFCLWEKHGAKDAKYPLNWNDDFMGCMKKISEFANHPICINFQFAKIGKLSVGFYHACSTIVDHNLVRKWLKENCPNAQFTDAQNFHNVYHAAKK